MNNIAESDHSIKKELTNPELRKIDVQLRADFRQRIKDGYLSQKQLQTSTSFSQAHVSNFLSEKILGSLLAFDAFLTASGRSILDYLSPRKSPTSNDAIVIPIVRFKDALQPEIYPSLTLGTIAFTRPFEEKMPVSVSPQRIHWTRFIALNLDLEKWDPARSHLPHRGIIIIDRHCHLLENFRPATNPLFALRDPASRLTLNLLQLSNNSTTLLHRSQRIPAKTYTHANFPYTVIGRVCKSIQDE